MQHGSGNEVWEVGDEQQVMDEPVFLYLALVGIDEKSNLGESVKRDAYRQDDIQRWKIIVTDKADCSHKEIGIFEVSEKQEIGANANDEPTPSRGHYDLGDAQADEVIKTDGCKKEGDIAVIPIPIEKE